MRTTRPDTVAPQHALGRRPTHLKCAMHSHNVAVLARIEFRHTMNFENTLNSSVVDLIKNTEGEHTPHLMGVTRCCHTPKKNGNHIHDNKPG